MQPPGCRWASAAAAGVEAHSAGRGTSAGDPMTLYFEKLQVRWQIAAGGAMKALLPPALFNSTVKFREWWMEVFWINFLFVLQFHKIVAWLKFSGLQCIVKQLKWDKWCSGSRVPDYLLTSDEIIEINLYRITGMVLDSESLINFVLQQPQDKYV